MPHYAKTADQEMFTVSEAAEYLRISRAGIWRLARSGELRATRIFGRTLFQKKHLRDLVERSTGA